MSTAFIRSRVLPLAAAALFATSFFAAADTSSAPGSGPATFYAQKFAVTPSVAAMTELGRALFSEPAMSASGQLACSSCHDPGHGYGPPINLKIAQGGPDLGGSGFRTAPSLRYLQTVPAFAEHRFDEAVDESIDQGPNGGHTWDGRADQLHDQARLPLLSPREMANPSSAALVDRIGRAGYGPRFREAFGQDVLADPRRGFDAILLVLEVFQQSPRDFYPYSSRYDEYLRGHATLTKQEMRGLELFNDPRKGNCASCHPSEIRKGAFPQFTDFGYAALGVPRNASIPANRDAGFADLGLCGPERTDLAARIEYCGMFRVPTLRNVALRPAFFHNGRFRTLEEAVRFYAQRDNNPGRWYPVVRGAPVAFDDIPPRYRENVERGAPFGAKPGAPPALDATEIAAIVAFLRALTDADADVAQRANPGTRTELTPARQPRRSAAPVARP